jgi:hypothetical protein
MVTKLLSTCLAQKFRPQAKVEFFKKKGKFKIVYNQIEVKETQLSKCVSTF